MNWELDSILEQSISQMAQGKARVESCLLAYPAHADELAPLLVASEELLALPKPAISAEAKARIEGQLFEAAAASGLVRRERKPLVLPRLLRRPLPRIRLPRWRWAYSGIAAAIIVVLLLTTTFVGAANALPGSPFYPVKLATEEAWLWVAPKRDEPALHLRFAQRRLEEYQELVERGVHDETVLDAMVVHVEAALDGIEELPPAVALEVLNTAAEVVAGQQQVLAAMLADPSADLPPASRQKLDSILAGTFSWISRVEAMRWAIDPYGLGTLPEQLLTIVPAETDGAGQTLTATATPTSESTEDGPTPTSTGTSSGTEPGAVTSAPPTATSEPSPTSIVSATETPSPTPSEEKPTKETPPGQTKTPEPPGQTKTPKP